MKLMRLLLLVLVLCGCSDKAAIRATVDCYIYGSAVDGVGRPVAGVGVRRLARASTTNASGFWGLTLNVTPGGSYEFEVTPIPTGLEGPAGVVARLVNGKLVIQVPQGAGDKLGPFKLIFAGTSTPTYTPQPTPTLWQTPTLPMPSTLAPAPLPTSPTTGLWDVPDSIADEIAAEARLCYWEQLETYQVAESRRTFRWGRALELGVQVTNEHECYACGRAVRYMVFAEGIVVEDMTTGAIGIISPHGRWRCWDGGEPR